MNLLEQAFRAERLARSITDERTVEAFTRYARECREKAARPAEFLTSPAQPRPGPVLAARQATPITALPPLSSRTNPG
jgi:hypothetical protein